MLGSEDRKFEEGGWKSLDQRFRRPLLAYFLRRVADRAAAEDLTQEVFSRMVRRPDQNNGPTLEAYVFKVASAVLADCSRSQASRLSARLTGLPEGADLQLLPPSLVEERTPERVVLARTTLKLIEKALGELNERTRDIFLLSRMERMGHREIAARFGVSVSAVEKHVIKAVTHIAARIYGL